MLDAVLQHLKQDADAATKRLGQFLSIPSVSTDPAYGSDVVAGASWVADVLREIGLDVVVHETAGHPIVVGRSLEGSVGSDLPRVLFYGHYDVQPPDPLDAWTTPAFEPSIRGGAIYARGASDDKGQVCCFLEALRAWQATHGKLPVHVTVLIEGEEECGSVQLHPFIQSHRSELEADVALISDTTMWDTPTGPVVAITCGLRGLLYFDIQLHHANRDLHSGIYGGSLANPGNELVKVLGRLFDDQHRVTIPGFYDDVPGVDSQLLEQWSELGFDEAAFFGAIGVEQAYGEARYSTLERRWSRPACDVNGLYGGYGGTGAKTIIPGFAGAKVSFRLAPNQSSKKIAASFTQWLKSHDVHGCRWQITNLGHAEPVVVSSDSPYITAAAKAIKRVSGRQPVLVREGATIPVVADFKTTLGIDSLLIGFGLSDDCIHAPNEKFGLDSFALGCQTHAAFLAELAAVKAGSD